MSVVVVERRDAVAVVTLNRPERRNGVIVEMCTQLYDVLRDIAAGDARVLVLRGAGQDFCVGADLKGVATNPSANAPPSPERMERVYHASLLLHTMPQVTIAAIDGGCAGAGMGWAAACDFRFATPEARFATAFLKVGASGDMGLAWSLVRILGGARARELLLLPDKLSGAQALEIGLVSRLFDREALHREVGAIADELAGRDAQALRMGKANVLSAEQLPMAEYIDIETARHLQIAARPGMGARMAEAFSKAKDS